MEEGSFRCDANISIRPRGVDAFGIRAEIKNLNSFRHVEKALDYEIRRQQAVLEDGGQVIQETRLWNPDKNKTVSMRGKEDAHDYRYFPDPDLLPLVIDDAWIDEVKENLPELPDEKKKRFITEYSLPEYDASVLTSARELADYFEICLETFSKPKPVSNWIMGSLLALLNSEGKAIKDSPVSAPDLAELLKLVDNDVISGKTAKDVFDEMAKTGKAPKQIVEEKGLVQMSDQSDIEEIVSQVLSASPEEVEAYRNGKKKLMGFFVGQVMKKTKGRANPKMVNELLGKKLAP